MKKLFLILFLVVLIIANIINDDQKNSSKDIVVAQESHKLYIPRVSNPAPSFSVPQGAAWRYTRFMPHELMGMFGLSGYFHSSSWQESYWEDGGQPMIRVDWEWDTVSTFTEKLQYLEDKQYDGIWYLMNEPHVQENITHCQAAEAVHIAQQYDIPGTMIWWNGIWLHDLTEVLTCYRMLYDNTIPDGYIGLHGYDDLAYNYGWEEDSIPNFLSAACNIVWSHGYRHCTFSLSEIAVPNAQLGDASYRAQWNWLKGIDAVGKGEHFPISLINVMYFTHCPDCLSWSGYDWDTAFNSRFWVSWSRDFRYIERTNSGRALQDYIYEAGYNPYP